MRFLRVELAINNFSKPKNTIRIVHGTYDKGSCLGIPKEALNLKVWGGIRDSYYNRNKIRLETLYVMYKQYHPMDDDSSEEFSNGKKAVKALVKEMECELIKEFRNSEPQWFI